MAAALLDYRTKKIRGECEAGSHRFRSHRSHVGDSLGGSDYLRGRTFEGRYKRQRDWRSLSLLMRGVSLRLPFRQRENLTFGAVTESSAGEPESASELNRELTNPVSSIWSIANQFNNFELNNGQWNNNWNFQPVMPVSLTKDWNLITRPVMPFYNIVPHETSPGEFARDAGLGDLALVELLSPAHSGNWILGAGTYRHLPDCDLGVHGPGQMAAWAQCRW